MFTKIITTTKKILRSMKTGVQSEFFIPRSVCTISAIGGAYLVHEKDKPIVSSIMGGTCGCGYGIILSVMGRNVLPVVALALTGAAIVAERKIKDPKSAVTFFANKRFFKTACSSRNEIWYRASTW